MESKIEELSKIVKEMESCKTQKLFETTLDDHTRITKVTQEIYQLRVEMHQAFTLLLDIITED